MTNAQVTVNRADILKLTREAGADSLVAFFRHSVCSAKPGSGVEDELNMILDTEESLEVIRKAGADSFAAFVCIRVHSVSHPLSVEEIADYTGFTVDRTKEALYHLGLLCLGLKETGEGYHRSRHA